MSMSGGCPVRAVLRWSDDGAYVRLASGYKTFREARVFGECRDALSGHGTGHDGDREDDPAA